MCRVLREPYCDEITFNHGLLDDMRIVWKGCIKRLDRANQFIRAERFGKARYVQGQVVGDELAHAIQLAGVNRGEELMDRLLVPSLLRGSRLLARTRQANKEEQRGRFDQTEAWDRRLLCNLVLLPSPGASHMGSSTARRSCRWLTSCR